MDEPLSNLDAKLRVQTRTQIASLQRRLGVTTVYVTHDQVEAMTMGDRVAVLKDGLLQQCDSPRRMYDHPNNVFVAGFIGSPAMNLLDVPVDRRWRHRSATPSSPVDARRIAGASGKDVTLGVRPEDLELPTDGHGIAVTVDVVEELGADAYIYGPTKAAQHVDEDDSDAPEKPFIARVDGRRPPAKGETIYLAPSRATCTCSTPQSGLRARRLTETHDRVCRVAGSRSREPATPVCPDLRTADAALARRCWEHDDVALEITAARPDPALLDLPVGAPARGLARGAPGRAAPRHLAARRPVRRALRPGPRGQGDQGRHRAPRVRRCCGCSTGSTCPASSRSAWSAAGSAADGDAPRRRA